MFAKLLKHEFRSQQKLLTILSIAALGAGLIGGITMWFLFRLVNDATNEPATAIGGILSAIVLMGIILAIAAYVITVWILLVYRFYKHHFSQEGYLTFTLPVTTHQLLHSSITNIVIWILISGVVCAVAVCMIFAPILYQAVEEGFRISYLESYFRELFSFITPGQMALRGLSALTSFVYSTLMPLVCIAIGTLMTKKYRLLASFGLYYGINMLMSAFTGIFTVAITISGVSSPDSGERLLTLSQLVPIVLQLGLSVAGYFLMHRTMDKKLNLP